MIIVRIVNAYITMNNDNVLYFVFSINNSLWFF